MTSSVSSASSSCPPHTGETPVIVASSPSCGVKTNADNINRITTAASCTIVASHASASYSSYATTTTTTNTSGLTVIHASAASSSTAAALGSWPCINCNNRGGSSSTGGLIANPCSSCNSSSSSNNSSCYSSGSGPDQTITDSSCVHSCCVCSAHYAHVTTLTTAPSHLECFVSHTASHFSPPLDITTDNSNEPSSTANSDLSGLVGCNTRSSSSLYTTVSNSDILDVSSSTSSPCSLTSGRYYASGDDVLAPVASAGIASVRVSVGSRVSGLLGGLSLSGNIMKPSSLGIRDKFSPTLRRRVAAFSSSKDSTTNTTTNATSHHGSSTRDFRLQSLRHLEKLASYKRAHFKPDSFHPETQPIHEEFSGESSDLTSSLFRAKAKTKLASICRFDSDSKLINTPIDLVSIQSIKNLSSLKAIKSSEDLIHGGSLPNLVKSGIFDSKAKLLNDSSGSIHCINSESGDDCIQEHTETGKKMLAIGVPTINVSDTVSDTSDTASYQQQWPSLPSVVTMVTPLLPPSISYCSSTETEHHIPTPLSVAATPLGPEPDSDASSHINTGKLPCKTILLPPPSLPAYIYISLTSSFITFRINTTVKYP